jgi:hypothetical protein
MKKKPAKPGRVYLSKGISIDLELFDLAQERAEALGLKWSEYVVGCLKRDLVSDGDFVIPSQKVIKPHK